MSEGNGRVVTLLRIASELRTRLDWQATASEVEAAAADIKQLSSSLTEAREALAKYGHHLDECATIQGWGNDNPCTCGLRNLLDANAREGGQ